MGFSADDGDGDGDAFNGPWRGKGLRERGAAFKPAALVLVLPTEETFKGSNGGQMGN